MHYIISVIGTHAGESIHQIFERKIKDIQKTGKTYWLYKSYGAKPDMVQKICNDAKIKNEKVITYFISPSSITGAIATKEAIKAENYSINKKDWKTLPSNISPVTGNLKNIAYALVIKDLEIIAKDTIDLWDYADYFEKNNPIKLIQGRSTVCACMKNMKDHPEKLKSNNRDLMAKCILCDPYCVWVK